MMEKESWIATMAPLLLRRLVTSVFVFTEQSLLNLSERSKLLRIIRDFLLYTFLLFLRILPSFFPSLLTTASYLELYSALKSSPVLAASGTTITTPPRVFSPNNRVGDSSIARALSQLLSLMNEIPVSSRKYEVVRGLAEKLIDENLREGSETLKEVNCAALSGVFSKTLRQLEATMSRQQEHRPVVNGDGEVGSGQLRRRRNRVLGAIRSFREGARNVLFADGVDGGGGSSAEKWAVELLWLARKMGDCGCVEEAEWRWGTASNLARLALTAEPHLQGSLVKVSAFLFKKVKRIREETEDEGKADQQREIKMKMLMTWLPLLCRASNGIDAPVLSSREREELERVLEEMIEMLRQEEEQEKVLALWLHHFTSCSSSDWPNLQGCYIRWCDASRKLLLLQGA
ncbi:uncharacterized protein LOC122073841 [Macadamia integrifolia]|uniref:uncharacterized protein LOC122073841 n=1 Tax=Macadamia integrifolia TaxID=60698 RepID=UPI001C4E79BB|nr:uncharacterized protein LOC122073841 [Macadamia integrifolia]